MQHFLRNSLWLTVLLGVLGCPTQAASAPADTVRVSADKLQLNALPLGQHSYLVYFKKTPNSPSERMMLVNLTVAADTHRGRPVVAVTQQWHKDTVVHAAQTLFRPDDFATLYHRTYWKRLGYTAELDFERHTVSYTGRPVPDSVRAKSAQGFEQAWAGYHLNWHADLVVFSLLPYRARTTFVVNYYDPGFGAPQPQHYTVIGTDVLPTHRGRRVACWVLSYTARDGSRQRFWIDKRTKEVLKEEDQFPGGYRYKVKLSVAAS